MVATEAVTTTTEEVMAPGLGVAPEAAAVEASQEAEVVQAGAVVVRALAAVVVAVAGMKTWTMTMVVSTLLVWMPVATVLRPRCSRVSVLVATLLT